MLTIRAAADWRDPDSLSSRMRRRRFDLFESMVSHIPRPLSILDVGGTSEFWERRGWAGRDDVRITLLNHKTQPAHHANMETGVGDATDLSRFADQGFDVVFSNSLIEHLQSLNRQRLMAQETMRVGRAIWVQTPNFWFPIEPHFHVPGWQWLPLRARIELLRRRRCGWRGPCPDPAGAAAIVREVRLLTHAELVKLFPGCPIMAERFGGLVKSWVVHRGLGPAESAEQKPRATWPGV